ncbi:NPB protein, partial [Sclerurus mexicanus]|nr:NPB protein [Sclerurus mexicanus]
ALLVLSRPAEPRYRQAARPRLCSVGRASGLLSSLRRPSHTRRSDTDGSARAAPCGTLGAVCAPAAAPRLYPCPPQVLCGTDVDPELRSCRALPAILASLQYRANVTVSSEPGKCVAA